MGGDQMFRTIQRTKARHAQLLVLLALASFADEHGLCYPSLRQIARRARVSRKTVIAAIRALTNAGELTMLHRGHVDRDSVKDRRRKGGFHPTHYYQLRVVEWRDHLKSDHLKGDQPGGVVPAAKVVKSRDRHSSIHNKSLNKSAANRAAGRPSREEMLALDQKVVRGLLNNDPELAGEPLLNAAIEWYERRSLPYDVDTIGEAIETELATPIENQKKAAS